MQAKMLREEEITHPDLKSPRDVVAWRAKLDRDEITPQEWRDGMFLRVKAGTVIDHPHAHRLVAMGMATPHDKECADRCKRMRLDPDVTAEGQDNVRRLQLTGDPSLDRDDVTDTDDADLDAEESKIVIPSSTLSTSGELTVIVANPALEVSVPADQQSDQQKAPPAADAAE